MNDKDIDKLFKEGLTKRDVDYNPANWEKMSALLDERPVIFDKSKSNYNLIIIGLSLVLSLLIFYGIKGALNKSKIDEASLVFDHAQVEFSNEINIDDQLSSSNVTFYSSLEQKKNNVFTGDLSSDLSERTDFLTDAEGWAQNKNSDTGTLDSEIEQVDGRIDLSEKEVNLSYLSRINMMDLEEQFLLAEFDSDHSIPMSVGVDGSEGNRIHEAKKVIEELELLNNTVDLFVSNKEVKLMRTGLSMGKGSNKVRFTFDAAIGAGLVQDLKYSSLRGALFAGVEFSRSYGFRTGIILSTIETPEYSGYRYESTFYGFGLMKSSYDLAVNKNKSISIPLEFVFNKGRHSVYSGVEVEKIIASKGSLTVTNYSQYNGNSSTDALESSIWVDDSEVLPQANFNFIIGYDYLLAKSVGVGIRIESPMTFNDNLRVNQEVFSPNNSYWGRIYFNVKYKIFK